MARASELSMLGERLPAGKALEWGLINRVVADEQLEQEVAGLRSVLASVRELQERSAATETMLAQLRQEQGEIRDRLAAIVQRIAQSGQEQSEVRDRLATIVQQMTQSGQEQSENISQLAAGQGNLSNELRERIQQVLDEQRVSLRQVSLKTSEEAVLTDRARRATELRLDELARRVPEQPA